MAVLGSASPLPTNTKFHPQNASPFDRPHHAMWCAKGMGEAGGEGGGQSVHLRKQKMNIEKNYNLTQLISRFACTNVREFKCSN